MGRVFWEEAAREGAGLHPGRCSQLKTYRSCTKGLRDGMGETELRAQGMSSATCPSHRGCWTLPTYYPVISKGFRQSSIGLAP